MLTIFKLNSLIVLLALTCFAMSVSAQSVTTITLDDPNEALMLNEFGALILNVNDTARVQMVSPIDQRDDIYQDVDIQVGDIIKMANGVRILKVKTLKDIYDNANPGDLIKLGIFRDKQVVMTKFAKGDFEVQPGGITMMTMTFDSEDEITQPLIGIGLILEEKDGGVTISGTIENLTLEFKGQKPQTGDIVTGIQGKEVESSQNLDDIYQSIKPGEKVKLSLLHGKSKFETSFIKPDTPPVETIIKKTE